MDAADRELLAASAHAAIDGTAPTGANDLALDALGWSDMLTAEPRDAVAVVFHRLGRAAASSSLLDDVAGAAFGIPPGATVVHPPWGAATPGNSGTASRHRIESAEVVHVVQRDGVEVVDVGAVVRGTTTGDGHLVSVTIDGSRIEWTPHSAEALASAVSAARHALAHQLHGLAAGMLALARQHAADRLQFGRPIGSFQAVRHKLAETHVAVEAAGDALAVADAGGPLAVDLGRVLAGRAAIEAGRHCQQVLAGIGFTRDHDFHRFLFAALEIDGLYGTTSRLTQDLGRQLLTDRDVPRTVDL